MGETAAETVAEIEATRGRLDSDLRELETRLPPPAVWGKRLVGVAVGGGVGSALLLFGARRMRARRRARRARQAPVQAVVGVLPDEWSKALGRTLESEEWKGWLLLVLAAWGVFRLAELRQLRRMNRALLAGAASGRV